MKSNGYWHVGYWHVINNRGRESKRYWKNYHQMAVYANRVYGLNNWTYQWRK